MNDTTRAKSLKARIDAGELIKQDGCELACVGDTYFLIGATGEHRLHRFATDNARLDAHWAGFCEINRAKGA